MKKVEKCVVCGEKACVKKQGKNFCKWCVIASTYFAEEPHKEKWVRVAKPSAY